MPALWRRQAYHLFCPKPRHGRPPPRVLDPTGGGPTRGFVAAMRGLAYTCVELRCVCVCVCAGVSACI